MAQHSKIVGGSTAKRVIACPGSVALVDRMPPQPSSSYADEGTLLHDAIAEILEGDAAARSLFGAQAWLRGDDAEFDRRQAACRVGRAERDRP
jgi:hypothetical protein